MKKIIIAAICGCCLCAGMLMASNTDNTLSVAGSAGRVHVTS